jgi:hypothetical protein
MSDLYDTDMLAWSKQQADLLRRQMTVRRMREAVRQWGIALLVGAGAGNVVGLAPEKIP